MDEVTTEDTNPPLTPEQIAAQKAIRQAGHVFAKVISANAHMNGTSKAIDKVTEAIMWGVRGVTGAAIG